MKKFISILSLTLGLLVSTIAFVACGSDDDDPQTPTPSNPLIGTWYTHSTYLTFKSDMTCHREEYYGDKLDMVNDGIYEIKDGNKLSIWWDGSKNPWTTVFTVSGNQLITTEKGGVTWTKQ